MSVSDICHWLQGICRSKIGVKSETMINASSEWHINRQGSLEDTLEICGNFFKTWNAILDHLQVHQHFNSPFQLLKFLFHELIIEELEMVVNEKMAHQIIYHVVENNHYAAFMASMGSDFLTRIQSSSNATDENEYQIKALTVKQEVFEASLQQQQVMKTLIFCVSKRPISDLKIIFF